MQFLVAILLACTAFTSASPSTPWLGYPYNYATPYYPGPLASPVVLPSGYLADTPEVAHAKATHAARLSSAAAAAAAAPDYPETEVLPGGFLADTPEVAAAKAAHFAAVAKAGGSYPYYPIPYAAGHDGYYVPDHNGW